MPPHADRKAKAELVITNQISELKFQRLGRLNIKSCPSRLSMLCSIIRKCLSVLITSANDFQKKQIYVTSKAECVNSRLPPARSLQIPYPTFIRRVISPFLRQAVWFTVHKVQSHLSMQSQSDRYVIVFNHFVLVPVNYC